jgi:uncharacterized protein (DUF362 family)
VAGDDPVAVDLVCVKMMGFDWKRIPTYANVRRIDRYRIGCSEPDAIEILSNDQRYAYMSSDAKNCFSFRPADGWSGNIEL